ncbi:MAG: Acetyl-CoA:oxalate CoA-transferase [Alphaproteobacteria bacterium MarineAlpha5_Bin6]|nr:MAG: Acetyl-CoA:oxalate CoA-transferase [Alphaproteobacteria bacterium MarineAlpha5_Bin7]PPR54832.1 MAG: Acetyl-CoA:oxalate CoA-transferase [Alphaproteobacteria bacterium MarineAlpha5_Bin6]|tara:strand:+ start:148 stop:1302 length:1155 start_codon:yes stop_codon:yes gene_type:complete
MSTNSKPLDGFVVLEFSQFLSGPVAGLRLSDLGARVIKIERPGVGDLCRNLYISDTDLEGDSTLFHAINRNKESFEANLKDPKDLEKLKKLISKADIITQNFRPGVIERIGLDYKNVKKINPKIVYGTISGYGDKGPWKDLPGQDLLAQSRSGLVWLNGNGGEAPTPMGLAAADMLAGHYLVEGILSALVKSLKTDIGSYVETSLMEALLDFQFEVLTTYLNDGNRKPVRSSFNNAHAYLSAPYGIYKTSDGYLAIAMTPIPQLGELLKLDSITTFTDQKEWFTKRDEIKKMIGNWLIKQSTQYWLDILQPADIWCAEVLEWDKMMQNDGFKVLDMLQRIKRFDGLDIETLRCPIRINNEVYKSDRAAPVIGQHTKQIIEEFSL